MKTSFYVIALILLVFFPISANATDWTITNPMSMGYTNFVSDEFVITGNFASVGNGSTYDLAGGGTYTSSVIFYNGNNLLYTMINPIDNTRWGTDEQGNVFYTTALSPIDYSAGFFTAGVGGSCSGIGGNCNNLHRVGILSATTSNRKMTFDSSGNVYTNDGETIVRYVRTLGYSQQTFYTLVSGTDYTPGNQATLLVDVLGINIDTSDNVHLLVGSRSSGGAGGRSGYLSYTVINSAGVRVKSDLSIESDTAGAGSTDSGFLYGGLVIDTSNPNTNYTYAGHRQFNANFVLKHNNSAGAATTISALTGITSIGDIGYNNFQIYLASYAQNLIRSYVTDFEGLIFSSVPSNEDGITGTFTWLNGYGASVTTINPGSSLSYRWTISNDLPNYTFWSGWASNTQTEPGQLRDLTDLSGLGKPAVFNTNSNELAGTYIYGYLLARRNNDSSWSMLATPRALSINPAAVGYDSITLDKTFYNLTGDTISATITYSSGVPYVYKWQACTRVDCADGLFFNQKSLIAFPSSSTMATDGLKEGNYYAVLMRHLPILTDLTNEIVGSQRFEVRPPVIGVSWDKPVYNLFPKSQTSVCNDSTPSVSYWTNITGYAGLRRGWFSCSLTPAEADANNSIMRGSLFARYNGTFYLNNSLGNIWNGTLNNGSGALIYVLTNSSVTQTWTLTGINMSAPGAALYNETYYANTEVKAASSLGYSISVSPNPAYNQDTLYLAFTKPIFINDYVEIRDAGGVVVAQFPPTATSGTYYIDPTKQYTYGTWTAYWYFGSIGSNNPVTQTVFPFTVKNKGRPQVNGSITPDEPTAVGSETAISLIEFLGVIAFWGLVLWLGIVGAAIKMMVSRGGQVNGTALLGISWFAAVAIALIGLFDPYKMYVIILSTVIAAVLFKFGRQTTVEG